MNNSIVTINQVSVSFNDTRALDNISFNIHAGEVLALLGENGAGKSTLINCILGRLKVNKGEISIFAAKPGEQAAKQRTGTILQSANLPDNTTVAEQLALFSSYYPDAMEISALTQLAMLNGLENRRLNTLSGGQRQRLFFALAVCGNPHIIFLDEPTVGLDTGSRREFWQCIENLKSNGAAIVLTTHYLEEAEALADRIILLRQGRIIHQGTPTEVKSRALGKRVSFHCKQAKALLDACMVTLNQHFPDTKIANLEINKDKVSLTTARPEQLLKALFQSDAKLTELVIEQARLEDAITILSQESNTHSVKTERAA